MKSERSIKLALFDLDGTLTRERSAWEYIHRRLGVWDGYAEQFQEAFLRQEISYERFCQLDATIWKGMRVSAVRQILMDIPVYRGIEEFLGYLRSKGIRLGIISSGLSLLADWVAERYFFDFAVANELGMENDVLNGEIKINVHHDRKGEWVTKARRHFHASQEGVLAVGDSVGDRGMFQMAEISIAFNSLSQQLESMATFSIRSEDLRDLIPPLVPHLGPRDGGGDPG
jgi:phosphoserine phosphatase